MSLGRVVCDRKEHSARGRLEHSCRRARGGAGRADQRVACLCKSSTLSKANANDIDLNWQCEGSELVGCGNR